MSPLGALAFGASNLAFLDIHLNQAIAALGNTAPVFTANPINGKHRHHRHGIEWNARRLHDRCGQRHPGLLKNQRPRQLTAACSSAFALRIERPLASIAEMPFTSHGPNTPSHASSPRIPAAWSFRRATCPFPTVSADCPKHGEATGRSAAISRRRSRCFWGRRTPAARTFPCRTTPSGRGPRGSSAAGPVTPPRASWPRRGVGNSTGAWSRPWASVTTRGGCSPMKTPGWPSSARR